jgi:hypothetical protein
MSVKYLRFCKFRDAAQFDGNHVTAAPQVWSKRASTNYVKEIRLEGNWITLVPWSKKDTHGSQGNYPSGPDVLVPVSNLISGVAFTERDHLDVRDYGRVMEDDRERAAEEAKKQAGAMPAVPMQPPADRRLSIAFQAGEVN